MGWSYRKSYSVGPFRISVSKSGVGYSVGGRGFRYGVNSHGRSYTSASIPGTGLRYYKSGGPNGSTGCLVVVLAALGVLSSTAVCFFASILWLR